MPSFLSQATINSLTGTFRSHFEQFSSGIGNYITVYKESLQSINNPDSINIYGYNSDTNSSNTDITYIEQKRDIPAMIMYPANASSVGFPQLRTDIDTNSLTIKVDQDGADYINNGKTERIIVNGIIYNLKSATPNVQNFFSLRFYYYSLGVTT
jgi:hypothetical protein